MKEVFSGYKVQQAARNDIKAAFNVGQKRTTEFASPTIALQGVPGEYDFRKFITPQMQNMVPVHYPSGGSVVSSLAVVTNPNQWRDYDPGRYVGLAAPAGEYAAPPTKTITYEAVIGGGFKPVEESAVPDVAVPPTKAVIIHKSNAGGFSVRIVQSTDTA